MIRLAFAIIVALLSQPAWAHKPSDSYLSLAVQHDRIDGRWDVALRDLHEAVGLDVDDDGAITWREVRTRQPEIAAYALSRLTLRSQEAACRSTAADQLIDQHTDGTYAVLRFTATCPAPIDQLTIDYRLLFDLDAQHKGLLRLTHGQDTQTAIFAQDSPGRSFTLGETSAWNQVRQYLHEGIWHIWLGFDHVLFLLALLLPAVLTRVGNHWEAAPTFSSSFWEVASIVTAFTIAHSITLGLATLGVIQPPARLVESSIAASVILAALANLFPTMTRRRWLVAFGFGLIHGFGFASVLSDLGLPHSALLLSLVSFNVGVEVGQLAIVSVFLPAAYAMRESWPYQRMIVVGGSVAVILLASVWLIERALNLRLLPI